MPKCSRCGRELDSSMFYKDKTVKTGIQRYCKYCVAINARESYKRMKGTKDIARKIRRWARDTIGKHRHNGFDVRFSIDELYIAALGTDTCSICGKHLNWFEDKQGFKCRDTPTVDRIDNENIMTIDNIQIVCFDCNRMKGDKTMEELITQCRLISDKWS